ncbi:MAG: hypothetical protein JWO52_6349 [Gammaproteobacteria bacterium]|nr:hypothetical protein [Gammaproteobacteria bacterium]
MSNRKSSRKPDEQDTPGRPTETGSRQQQQPCQGSQTGNPEIDSKAKDPPPSTPDVRNEK